MSGCQQIEQQIGRIISLVFFIEVLQSDFLVKKHDFVLIVAKLTYPLTSIIVIVLRGSCFDRVSLKGGTEFLNTFTNCSFCFEVPCRYILI